MNNRKRIKTGTLSKLSRRVRRTQARALRARGAREKEMVKAAFARGFTYGAEMLKTRILNATAGMPYEQEEEGISNVETRCSDTESDSGLAFPIDACDFGPQVECIDGDPAHLTPVPAE